jgi:hypothetical protein
MLPRHRGWSVSTLLTIGLLAGCNGSPEPQTPRPATPKAKSAASKKPAPAPSHARPKSPAETPAHPEPPPARNAAAPPADSGPRGLADLLETPPDAVARMIPDLPRTKVDDARAAALGIRKLTGKHLDLYTDFAPTPEIDALPEVFDQAFPQWCAYFHVDPARHVDWRLTGCVIRDRDRFKQAGLLPDDLPPFPHAYARNFDFWVYDQPSEYYRRHLVLHEGTHCFMNTLLGACGPPWYMEGIAELLSTHRWHDGRLELNYLPATKDETPMLGRIKIVKDAFAAGRARRWEDVLAYDAHAHVETEPYAWCWAACLLLDRHPRYQARFRRLWEDVLRPDFNQRFLQALGDDGPRLDEEWQVFVASLEYGMDVARGVLDFAPGKPLPPDGATVEVAADRGWQNSGVRLEQGASYRLRAEGRYQVADKPQIWWCEPGGVTIRYYQGRPLGILLAAVRPDSPAKTSTAAVADRGADAGPSPLVRPTVVGLETVLQPDVSGTLYLKINDSAAELGDNTGRLSVRITRQ